MATNEELVAILLNEAKKIVGLNRLKGKQIKWVWAKDSELKKYGARAFIRESKNNPNHYTIYLKKKDFTTIDWRYYEYDEETGRTLVKYVKFDSKGKPLLEYKKEYNDRLRFWVTSRMHSPIHELVHISDLNLPEEEVERKAIKLAQRVWEQLRRSEKMFRLMKLIGKMINPAISS